MATLDSLKNALRQAAKEALPAMPEPLSDAQYQAGYDILTLGLESVTYDEFITPQLSNLLRPFESRSSTSVLEIGPGPGSVLSKVPYHTRRIITKYTAYEPNGLYATSLEVSLRHCGEGTSQLPCLEAQADIRRTAFTADTTPSGGSDKSSCDEAFDVILFCHSMYGMRPKRAFLEKALRMLAEGGIVIVFHRGESLFFDNLACHRTAGFPTGKASVQNSDRPLALFASFIAGFLPPKTDTGQILLSRWLMICRHLGGTDAREPDSLSFSCPAVMVAFTKNATALSGLIARIPVVEHKKLKSRDARLQQSAAHARPRDIEDVQHCVRWAIDNTLQLTIVSGSHSDHCIRSNVVAIDMANFNHVNIVELDLEPMHLIVAGSGCKTEDIIRKSVEKGLVVPLGARPSIGSGLWLRGGIGHLTRQYGLTCDAIAGAVLVTVDTAQVIYVGNVPRQYRPPGAVRATNEIELLWGLQGAGTNFGIVVYVVFKAFPASITGVRSWSYGVNSQSEAQRELGLFEESVAKSLPRHCSADMYLQCKAGQFLLSGAIFERCSDNQPKTPISWPMNNSRALDRTWQAKDHMELFDADLYMTGINGGHERGKTSSFKRCIFLQDIGAESRAAALVRAFDSRPSDLCYLHLLHGGGAANDVEADLSAFGCRGWTYACVITAVWPREDDDSRAANDAKQWVYCVANDLLPLSVGVYSADLGPDPRDLVLAQKAFGPNLARLAQLKKVMDPFNVLAYACPLPKRAIEQKLVIIVTGESCAGKDYCAEIWASVFASQNIAVRVVSVSDATKTEYARTTGADIHRLRHERAYKELHRGRLTAFFQGQVQQRPRLPEEHFQAIVDGADDLDVLLITGMRDRAPVATLSHLVPEKKLIEVNVAASRFVRQARNRFGSDDGGDASKWPGEVNEDGIVGSKSSGHCPDFVFDNFVDGDRRAEAFAERHLLPLVSDKLRQLADTIRTVPNFPRPGIAFRHVLNIPQQRGGLATCTSLLQNHFGDWSKIDAIVCCEAGAFIYGSALALQTGIPMVTVRKDGKLPPPTISVAKSPSHISSPAFGGSEEEIIEMSGDALSSTASVVIVDDVLATGRTLLAVLRLLKEAGVDAENVCAQVVAEFPVHRGRALLRDSGFGMVRIQSLLVFQGA